MRIVLVSVLLALALSLNLAPLSYAVEKSASFSREVAAGKWTGVRLRNLPKGASLAVQVKTDGEVTALLLNETSYRRLPAVDRPLFQGKTADRISFSIRVPETGNYYLVLDNRDGVEARKFTIDVKAAADTATQRQTSVVDTELAKLSDTLGKIFVFDALTIRAAKCGKPNAFSVAKGVVICAEYARELLDALDDKQKAADAIMFILLHEVGHTLLRQWDYPFFGNEEIADEFATAVMVMFKQQARVRSQAEYFVSRPTADELKRKLKKDDRHPLSVQRARNILRWVDDPQFARKWQPVLVPHMQTAFLQALKQNPPSWAASELVERELALRK